MKHIIKIESDISTGKILNDIKETLGFEVRALDQARYIELPCEVGDVVWCYIKALDEVCEGLVIKTEQNYFTTPSDWITVEYISRLIGTQSLYSRIDLVLNKTIFLTKEQAEKALKEMGL